MNREALETMSAAGSKATVAGASLTGWGWVVSNEFFGLMGVAIALCGLLMNVYSRRKADARAAAEDARREREYQARQAEREARQAERQLRMDLMRITQRPVWPPEEPESDLAKLEPSE